jgi:hypothetical protein
MPAVGCPETSIGGHDSDDGIEKTPSLTNNVSQSFVMSVGEIALERRWLDLVDGENGKQGLMTAKWLLIEAHHAPSSLLDSVRCFGGRSF